MPGAGRAYRRASLRTGEMMVDYSGDRGNGIRGIARIRRTNRADAGINRDVDRMRTSDEVAGTQDFQMKEETIFVRVDALPDGSSNFTVDQ